MAETSISHLIWFVVSIALAGSIAIGLSVYVQSLTEGIEDRAEALTGSLTTDIAIINDPGYVPYSSGTNELVLYLKNTGSSTLNMKNIVILIDGVVISFPDDTVSIMTDGYSQWSRGVVIEIRLTVIGLDVNSDHRLFIDVSNVDGSAHAEDLLIFRPVSV